MIHFVWDNLLSSQALVPAALGGVSLVMGWRGLHLGGESPERIKLWGGLFLIMFLAAWVSGAVQAYEADNLVDAANRRADGSARQLQDIAGGIGDIKRLVAPDRLTTTKEVLDAAAAQLVEQDRRIRSLEHRSDPRHLTENQKQLMTASLKSLMTMFKRVDIAATADGNSQDYATDFVKLFRSVGILSDGPTFLIAESADCAGVVVVMKDVARVPPPANSLALLIQAAGIRVSRGTLEMEPDAFRLVICPPG